MANNRDRLITSRDLVVGPPISVGLEDARSVLLNILEICFVNVGLSVNINTYRQSEVPRGH